MEGEGEVGREEGERGGKRRGRRAYSSRMMELSLLVSTTNASLSPCAA